ncbi:hypothetical protein [Aquimarina mytili]|uniref:Uncharacterized protein n=1 Tax=Aquimarina mytili TaxID=874423 RepID=A0A937A0H7_9FLAO|nr:hypothetical protein [Aquimarina mytili]MBL0685746.1 hypothetical protein [Aquimarina mytili]
MKLLIDKYSQAEIAMVLNAKEISFPYLSTLIFFDLIARDVLTTVGEGGEQLYLALDSIHFKSGERLDEYVQKEFEKKLLKHFRNTRHSFSIFYIFNHFFEDYNNEYDLKRDIINSENLLGLFDLHYNLTKKGKLLKQEILSNYSAFGEIKGLNYFTVLAPYKQNSNEGYPADFFKKRIIIDDFEDTFEIKLIDTVFEFFYDQWLKEKKLKSLHGKLQWGKYGGGPTDAPI